MKYEPWLHNLKQKFKESKNWNVIQHIQRTAPDIIKRDAFLVQVKKWIERARRNRVGLSLFIIPSIAFFVFCLFEMSFSSLSFNIALSTKCAINIHV